MKPLGRSRLWEDCVGEWDDGTGFHGRILALLDGEDPELAQDVHEFVPSSAVK